MDAVDAEFIVQVRTRGQTSHADIRDQLTLPNALAVIAMAESGNFPDIARFYQEEVMAPGDELFARVLARGVERGEFRAMPPNPTTTLICAPLAFLMLWQRAFGLYAHKDIDPDAYIDNLLEMLLFGLTAGEARNRPLPPKSGPYVWEKIRDDMLAQRAEGPDAAVSGATAQQDKT